MDSITLTLTPSLFEVLGDAVEKYQDELDDYLDCHRKGLGDSSPEDVQRVKNDWDHCEEILKLIRIINRGNTI